MVLVARNEQDATIKKATAVIPDTLVLTRADFPVMNKKIKDCYPTAIVQAMFAACKKLRELLILSFFYYTGGHENEVGAKMWKDCPCLKRVAA